MGASLAGNGAEPSRGPLTPGLWLMRRLSPRIRLALVLALAVLPALPWLSPAGRLAALPHAWIPLLVVALYGWVCAALAARNGEPPAVPSEAVAPAPPLIQALRSDAGGALAAADAEPSAAPSDPGSPLPAPTGPMPEPDPRPATAAVAMAVPEPADLRVGNAEVRGTTDEIARRVVGTSGLLDACSKSAADALADIEALADEDRHARKLLSALRGRTLQLDQRCHALAQAALQAARDEEGAARLGKQLQAVEALVLHIHQLAERLGAAEHQHGARMESLRRSVERVDGCAERGLRESHQIMQLTRRVFSTLEAAEQDLRRVEAGADGRDDPVCRRG